MIGKEYLERLTGGNVIDEAGNKIGSVGQIYLDDHTGNPSWVTVKTGWFGTAETFVPLDSASTEGDDIRVPYSEDMVKNAPRVDVDQHLSVEEEEELYRYYGQDYAAGYAGTDVDRDVTVDRDVAVDRNLDRDVDVDRNLDRDVDVDRDRNLTDEEMVLHEERLVAGKEQREAGRARLRKYVVTEEQQVTVPVTREEVRVVREQLDGERVADGGIDLGEAETEVILHEERPVVGKETVATERVGLEKEQVTENVTVNETVAKEVLETEGLEGDRVRTDGTFDGDVNRDRDLDYDRDGDRGLDDKLKDAIDTDDDGRIGR